MEQPEVGYEDELNRIRAAYHLRGHGKVPVGRYSLFNEAALQHTYSVERELLGLLKRHHCTQLAERTVLDVGCGGGMQLRRFLEYGALPEQLTGVDLRPERIARARQLNPALNWVVASAHALPFADASFDIVLSSTLFSSILDEALQQCIAAEMLRVRKPGGLILCHDFTYDNPRNAAVRGLSRRRFARLFAQPGLAMDWRRVTLAPPLARRLAPHARWLALTLEQLQIFNTHMVAAVYDKP
jgi:ubiquinone/menaquinone biosynthesis C-methylase UbiE